MPTAPEVATNVSNLVLLTASDVVVPLPLVVTTSGQRPAVPPGPKMGIRSPRRESGQCGSTAPITRAITTAGAAPGPSRHRDAEAAWAWPFGSGPVEVRADRR